MRVQDPHLRFGSSQWYRPTHMYIVSLTRCMGHRGRGLGCTRGPWLLPKMSNGQHRTAASSQALDRAGPRTRAPGGGTTNPARDVDSCKLERYPAFTLQDSLVPTSCLASVARKEATSTQLCNTSRHVGTRSGAGPAVRPPATRRTYTMATQAMMTQTNYLRHHASQQRAQCGGDMRKQYPPAALTALHVTLCSAVQ
jgi:hypothetical protein